MSTLNLKPKKYNTFIKDKNINFKNSFSNQGNRNKKQKKIYASTLDLDFDELKLK